MDGDAASRWATDWSDPQWIGVDLGAVTTFQHVHLVWQGAFGRAYQIQVSDDGTSWRSASERRRATGVWTRST